MGYSFGVERPYGVKKMEISVESGAFVNFLVIWKARNTIVFRDEALSIEKLKFSFLNLLW